MTKTTMRDVCGVSVTYSVDFCVVLCRSLFVLIFWPIYCLCFFDVRLLNTPLVSSNFLDIGEMLQRGHLRFKNLNNHNILSQFLMLEVTGELVMDMIVCLVDLHLHMLLLPIIRKVEKVNFQVMVRCTRYKISELH